MSGLGERIRFAREEIGMTQQALADLVGIASASVSRIEREVFEPSLNVTVKIFETLGISPEILLAKKASAKTSSFERRIAEEVRALPRSDQLIVLDMIKSLKTRKGRR